MEELLKAGMEAPDFESVDQDGKRVKLSEYRGKPVVLYFYPKDDTPGCTAEACNFRDNLNMFKDNGITVLGVSVDSTTSHKKFQQKYNLNFTLVSDKQKEIVSKYGVMGMHGTAKRVTYIIDRNGKIAHVYDHVSPNQHGVEVFEKMKELKLF
ncbi:MAG: peroxiredoxin [Candidatus Thermoplasmatota archaeon]|nr:peroxiredoxin [Candidatus Thermoplasmatota archaeon]MCL5731312.1 peroxiredoxin [Candidatus Thermoplasmatota archaeon]